VPQGSDELLTGGDAILLVVVAQAQTCEYRGQANPYRCAPLIVATIGSGPFASNLSKVLAVHHPPNFLHHLYVH